MRFPRMRLDGSPFAGVTLDRTTGGVARVSGRDDLDLARGLGFAHAHDRMVQMMMVRLIGQGRLSECLQSNDETLGIDTFARDLAFARDAERDVSKLGDEARTQVGAYCEGVNAYLERHLPAAELLLLRYSPEPWRPADVLVTVKVMSYVGLAQTQLDAEKLIVQAIRGGVPLDRLRALFRPHLDGLDDETVAAIGLVRLEQGLVPPAVRFGGAIPKLVASNNWVVAASRSTTGSALSANDPHLEVNRLPGVWYEWVGLLPDDYRIGISMPGLPGLIMGRNRHLAFSFTYGFMDMVDYFVEDVQAGRVRRAAGDGARTAIAERVEIVRRRGADPVELRFRETSHGTLEADPRAPLADGLYLARAWSLSGGGAAGSMDGVAAMLRARDVTEGQAAARHSTISCNWLFADRGGRIAYQQSGCLPERAHSGLHPVLGWKPELAWRGLVPSERLVHVEDPPEGVLVTANEDWNRPGHPAAINLPMASWRADRIRALLADHPRLGTGDLARIQRDLYSLQAERLLAQWRPFLPPTRAGSVLRDWDLRYDAASLGAPLFERAYAAVLRETFGRNVFGLAAWDSLSDETSFVVDYHGVLDRALLEDGDAWWSHGPDAGRDSGLRRVLGQALADGTPLPTWGEVHQVTMTNVLFAGKLPAWTGVDHGPFPLEGGRATIVQAQIFRAHGRTTSFFPSWRCIADLARDELQTALAGGPSGRRTSSLYLEDVARWRRYEYKTLSAR